MKKEKSIAGNIIDCICRRDRIKRNEIAERMGVTHIYSMGTNDVKLSNFLNLLEKTGYCLVVSKNENAAGQVLFQDDPCFHCRYKLFTNAVDEAMENLHMAVSEAGVELDFYPDDGIVNQETE